MDQAKSYILDTLKGEDVNESWAAQASPGEPALKCLLSVLEWRLKLKSRPLVWRWYRRASASVRKSFYTWSTR